MEPGVSVYTILTGELTSQILVERQMLGQANAVHADRIQILRTCMSAAKDNAGPRGSVSQYFPPLVSDTFHSNISWLAAVVISGFSSMSENS
jgi:hypothetical protein